MTRTEARTLLGWLMNGEIVSTFSGTGNLREKQSHSQVNQRADNSQCVYNPKFLHLTLENARKDESSPGTMKATLTLTRGCQTASLTGLVWSVVSDRCDVSRWSGCWHHLEGNKMNLQAKPAPACWFQTDGAFGREQYLYIAVHFQGYPKRQL